MWLTKSKVVLLRFSKQNCNCNPIWTKSKQL